MTRLDDTVRRYRLTLAYLLLVVLSAGLWETGLWQAVTR